jgi:hypothetical protein
MDIRIPTDADQNTRTAFLDIQRRLDELSAENAMLRSELQRTTPTRDDEAQTSTLSLGDTFIDGTLEVGDRIYATPHAAMWKSNSESGSTPVWDTDVINTNTDMFTAESSDTQIHVNEAGYYRITVDFNLTLGAGVGANVDIQRNGSTIDARCTVDNGDTTGAVAKSGSVSCIVSAAATDYWKITKDAGTWQTNDAYNRFLIERLN